MKASCLVIACTLVLSLGAVTAQAANYYWDSNGSTAGFGNAAGTWGTSAFWTTITAPESRKVLGGTLPTVNTTIAAGDTVYFGTVNLALGSTASTIGIAAGGVLMSTGSSPV